MRSAAWGGHTDVVRLLIEHKNCDIDRADKEGRTALRAASWSGNEDIVRILIDAHANVNSIDRQVCFCLKSNELSFMIFFLINREEPV